MTTIDLPLDTVLKNNAAALTALIAWRNAELRGADVGSPEWTEFASRLRDAADRVLASVRGLREVLDTIEPIASPALVENRATEVVDLQRRTSSVAGLASFTGRHYPPRPVVEGERPCGHRLEDACEACVPGDGGAA